MTKDQRGPAAADDAADELAEVQGVFRSTRSLMANLIEELSTPGAEIPKALKDKIFTYLAAYLQVLKAKEMLNDKIGRTERDGDIDFDAMRAEIRSRLDKLRLAADPGGLSRGSDG
jgi:hypothetical protein